MTTTDSRRTDQRRRMAWLLPLTGLAFVLLAIAAVIVSDGGPTASDSPQEIIDFFQSHQGRQMASAILALIALTALVFFASYLRSVLRTRERDGGVLSTVAYLGLVILAVALAIDTTITVALTETADDLEPAAAQALTALWNNDYMPMVLGTTLFLLGTGIWVLQNAGLLPKWLGWVMIVLALLTYTPLGFFSFLAAGVLVGVISVVLTLQARKGPEGTAPYPEPEVGRTTTARERVTGE